MSRNAAIFVLRWIVGLISGLGALRLFIVLSHHGAGHLPTNILRVICAAELAAAVFFLIPRTMRAGGVALLVVYAVAAALHLLHGEYDISNLVLLGSAVVVILTS